MINSFQTLRLSICTLCILVIHSASVLSQTSSDTLIPVSYRIIGKVYTDSIVLRYCPTDIAALPPHIEAGAWIERAVVNVKTKAMVKTWEKLTSKPIRPLPVNDIKMPRYTEDEYSMVVAQLLYGKALTYPSTNLMEKIKMEGEATQNLFSLAAWSADMSPRAAHAFGLRFKDNIKITADQMILYRIYSAVQTRDFDIDTSTTIVTYDEQFGELYPQNLELISKEHAIEITWQHDKALDRFSAFDIYRSDDGVDFYKINKKPYFSFTPEEDATEHYIDSVENYIPYTYRVVGIDPWAEYSDYSIQTTSHARDLTPPSQVIVTESTEKGKGVRLDWKRQAEVPLESDFKEYRIVRGNRIDGVHELIGRVGSNQLTYFDPTPPKTSSTYYEIHSVDTSGNSTASMPVRSFVEDDVPPVAPFSLSGNIDTNGIVILNWKFDTTDVLRGFKVYVANDSSHVFTCVNDSFLLETKFSDTLSLRTLTPVIFYYVTAIDMSYNHSTPSTVLKLVKPDKIAPFPPQFDNYLVREDSISIYWQPSPSDDVKTLVLTKRTITDTVNFKEVKIPLSSTASVFHDKDLQASTMYEYRIQAKDTTGLISSYSFPLFVKSYSSFSKNEELKVSVMKEKQTVILQWTEPQRTPLYYVVYKDSGEGFLLYTSVEKYLEYQEPSGASKVRYGVQAVYEHQQKSPIYESSWVN